MKQRKVRNLIVVAVIGLFVLIVSLLAKAAIDNAYSSDDFVESKVEKPAKTVEPPEVRTSDFYTKKFDAEDAEDDMALSTDIYNDEGNDTDRKYWMGKEYDKYNKIIKEVGKEYKDIFSTLKTMKHIDSINPGRFANVGLDPNLNEEDVLAYDYINFNDSLTAISFYGGTYILCAYNFPDNEDNFLIMLDFTDHEFSVSGESIKYYLKGDVGVSVITSIATVKTIGDWRVMFVKV